MKNILVKIVLIIVVLVLVLGFLKDQIIKAAIVVGAKQVAGVDVVIDHFSLSVVKHAVLIKGVKLYSPSGFPNEVMIDAPAVEVHCNVWDVMRGVLHFSYIRLDLKELRVTKNKEGKLNVNSLAFMQKANGPANSFDKTLPQAQQNKERSQELRRKDIPMQFDLVRLNIGKVIYTDNLVGDKPSVKVMDINIKNKEFRNISSAAELGALVMVEAVSSTFLKNTVISIKGLGKGSASALIESIGSFLK
jgi:uncharacterized protein involved in outer membrane biogenesis